MVHSSSAPSLSPSPVAPVPNVESLRVDLGPRSYDVVIGPGLLASAGARLRALFSGERCFILTDSHVAPLYLALLKDSLRQAGFAAAEIVLSPGEEAKSWDCLGKTLDAMMRARCERSTPILALGGGVVGDLAGFAAAILLRGLPFVQIPTTLLAQVDSAVGGKTGINAPLGKNLVGAFHQPRLVLADTGVLATLPRRELLAGYAETAKYALIDDPDFWIWLETESSRFLALDPAAAGRAIRTCCAAKARIVAADECESGVRALLNLGHTFAHALEVESGYGRLLHGEAVAIGMVMAFDLSARLGLCPDEDARRVRARLAAVGLPVSPPVSMRAERLRAHMDGDKKVEGGKPVFVLARGIGKAFLCRDVPEDALHAVLAQAEAPPSPQ